MQNKNNNFFKNGLPEIAQKAKKVKPTIFLLFIATILILIIYFLSRNKSENIRPIDENYIVEGASQKESNFSISERRADLEKFSDKENTKENILILQEKQRELEQRLNAPLMVINDTKSHELLRGTASETVYGDSKNQLSDQTIAQNSELVIANIIEPLNYMILQGHIIHATLESAINTDLPGSLRAIVNQDIYSEDGTQILIPRGSKLIGQYKISMVEGGSRIFIAWTRLITPNAISIKIDSIGIDNLGIVGTKADEINRHFWQRFGMGSLLSVLGAGAANMEASGKEEAGSVSEYKNAIANNFSQSANQTLQQDMAIKTTLKAYQGKSIAVYVARDLNFQKAMVKVKPNVNIF